MNPTKSDVHSNVWLCNKTGGFRMTFQRVKRMAAAASVMVAAGALPILVASPASATQGACSNYVARHGYFAGPKVKAACGHEHHPIGASPLCLAGLLSIRVDMATAQRACTLA
ncbi:hypothetical protein [Streptomyces sp. NPDC096152]|uniref:hypothetical protein n=1 Tax=Streptomyces sp. NPDC096152 TaxID=3366078 RepID=UPI003817796F